MMFVLIMTMAMVDPPAVSPAPAISSPDYANLVDVAIDSGRLVQAEAMLAQWPADQELSNQAQRDIATARLALEKRQDAEALTRFSALSKAGSTDCRVNEGLGVVLVRLGRSAEAVQPLKQSVAACATRWRAWNALGVAQDQAQAWALSAAAYEHAYQLTDKPAQVLNNYGLSLLRQQQAEKAAVIFEKARQFAPEDERIITNGDAAYVMSGQEIQRRIGEKADQWAQRLSHAGQVAMRMGNVPRAQAYLSRAVTESDNFVPDAAAALVKMDDMAK